MAGVRRQFGMVAGFKSESRPASIRKYLAGMHRNLRILNGKGPCWVIRGRSPEIYAALNSNHTRYGT